MTLSGIEPEVFRLITRCLNQLSHRAPANYLSCTQHFRKLGTRFFSQDCRLVYWLYNDVVPTTKCYLDSIKFREVESLGERSVLVVLQGFPDFAWND